MHFGINAATMISKDLFSSTIFPLLMIVSMGILSSVPMSAFAPLFIFVFGIFLGILLIFIFAPEDFNFLTKLYLIGFILRVFLSFSFYIFSFVFSNICRPGFLFPNDGWAYSEQGWQIYRFAERGIKITPETFMSNPNMKGSILSGNITPYDFFASHVYSITGYSPLSLFFISSVAGALSALFLYFIAKELFSKNVARISSFLVFFWPSFIFWSTQNLKDPMIVMLICILLWAVIYICRHPFPGFMLLSILSFSALYTLGFHYALIVVSMLCFAAIFLWLDYFFCRKKIIVLLILGMASIVAVILLKDYVLAEFSKQNFLGIKDSGSMFYYIDMYRKNRAHGALQFFRNVDISNLGRTLFFVPIGLVFAIFAPFPWQIGSFAQIMAIPETIVFYFLFGPTVKGIIFACKKRFNQSILLLSIIVAILLSLALLEGNAGTLFRHRCIVFYLLFIFTGIGISLNKLHYRYKNI